MQPKSCNQIKSSAFQFCATPRRTNVFQNMRCHELTAGARAPTCSEWRRSLLFLIFFGVFFCQQLILSCVPSAPYLKSQLFFSFHTPPYLHYIYPQHHHPINIPISSPTSTLPKNKPRALDSKFKNSRNPNSYLLALLPRNEPRGIGQIHRPRNLPLSFSKKYR